eukprot:Gregarina_sp_Poly_1__5249@NODE_2781_length_1721_cov_159_166264_g1753_i0_p2_GENE_NODE_2781_length_1721_cov_159_166264_g1753_i0NODE_2781_length_1721_cov_159_166264_g1753_i0_p2_ORF_typecomplete_len164_score18_79HAD_2/PF13419_6/0_18SKG6/PF08693_10/5_1_NODE_2781_length_1721_cov_159_166264_g1753_i061552
MIRCFPKYESACRCWQGLGGVLKFILPPLYICDGTLINTRELTKRLLTAIGEEADLARMDDETRTNYYQKYFSFTNNEIQDLRILRPEAWDIVEERQPLSLDALLGIGEVSLPTVELSLGACIFNRVFLFFLLAIFGSILAAGFWFWRKRPRIRPAAKGHRRF